MTHPSASPGLRIELCSRHFACRPEGVCAANLLLLHSPSARYLRHAFPLTCYRAEHRRYPLALVLSPLLPPLAGSQSSYHFASSREQSLHIHHSLPLRRVTDASAALHGTLTRREDSLGKESRAVMKNASHLSSLKKQKLYSRRRCRATFSSICEEPRSAIPLIALSSVLSTGSPNRLPLTPQSSL